MPLIKPRELGGMKLPRPSSYVRLSENNNDGTGNDDEQYDVETPKAKGCVSVPGIKIVKIKDNLPRRPSYVKLSSSNNDNDNDNDNNEQQEGTPKGHVPVMVGKEEGQSKRFVVPTRFMKDPSIVELLQLSADEFGYNHQGVVQIPCEPSCFEKIIGKLSKKSR